MKQRVLLAHLDRDAGREQTLASHSENVAKLCAEFGAETGLRNLGRLTGLLHDSGKAARSFQEYLRSGDASLRGQIPHAFCGARYCYEAWGMDGDLKGLTAELVSSAVCAHHSGLPDVTGTEADDGLRRRAWPEKPVSYEEALDGFFRSVSKEELDGLFASAQSEVGGICGKIRAACSEIPESFRRKAFYFQLGLVQRYLLSCLIDADRYDTFLFETGGMAERAPSSPEFWGKLAGKLETFLSFFPAESPIDRERRRISEQCLAFSEHRRGIFRLSVPTGSGKTLSSLRYALGCAKSSGKKHIFYIAPYKSILEQNAEDIRRALDTDDDRVILEHHGDAVVGGNIQNADERKEEAERYELLTQRWDAPVILTTAVQFLNTLFDGRSACVRRMHSLANSVLILDEVQAMPVKCTDMVNAALNFLAYVCGCAVVLCTATQPESKDLPVPVVPGKPAQMTENREETFAAFRRTRAVDKTPEGPLSAGELAEFTFGRLASCDNALLVFNTKAAARAVYRAAAERMQEFPPEQRAPVYCLTTSLCPQHRVDFIEEIRTSLASQKPGANRLVCVSTQLIEAGVNLSFQCAVRSLAGLDSIAQAAGRCNRHGEAACRDVFIVRCAEENLSRLKDIQAAQRACLKTLENFRSNPARFGNDLLSPEAVRQYYSYYYEKLMPQLDYPVNQKDGSGLWADTNLFGLLSENPLALKYSRENEIPLPEHLLHQAYQTAGRLFEAIEKGGMDVIVPYKEGKELISELYAEPDMKELPGLLRRAQRYTVHLFEGERYALSELGAIDVLPDTGAAVMRGEFYDGKLGLQPSPAKMSLEIV